MLFNQDLLKYHRLPLVCILLSLILYASFVYNLVRTEALKLLLLYSALFVFAYILKKSLDSNASKPKISFGFLAIAAVLFRLVFLPAIPNLSQDFYRFIWDGRMLLEGFNPYLFTPDSFILNGQFPISQAQELYNGMGALSASHYTNYPPINQLCFYFAALFSGNNITGAVIILRLLIIAADIGTLWFGKKLLEHLNLSAHRIWLYILNPFIIIELTGNLHFEGVMIFFLVWSLYLLQSGKWKWAAVVLACSISVKLIPLMFLPIFFWWFPKEKNHRIPDLKKLIAFYSIVLITTAILFLPFFSMEFIDNYAQTVGLWFSNFEFNASIYYLAREIGYAITGYNEIKVIGKIMPLVSIAIILCFSLFKKNNSLPKLAESMLLTFTFYLFLSTTVHPWYIATLVILCLFTNYRFPIIWSAVIVLSYLSYLTIGTADKSENLWIIALEYGIVFSVFVYEVLLNRRLKI
ncbi:uncharacterized protein DUF2029 [Winogradskyella wandonensis]|uniref:Uncharacterized protein DUF2029 n=1 Tax=Winogradskyella wandonensis TaxID=1442586 RepID=A0A4R1KS79_9FLAO|nr:DUF2029 domain-containing protein [Winogradskyella wandonensis]TCK67443.1 uncharacterized protein DUF2029 [Winogradskyella wandonensis]